MSNKKLYIYTDFDGTITKKDLGDEIFKVFGKFEPYHSMLLAGEMKIDQYWKTLLEEIVADENDIIKFANEAETDAYFKEFSEYCKINNIPFAVVSDGFDTYIKTVLSKLNADVKVFSNSINWNVSPPLPHFPGAAEACTCLCASCKKNYLLVNTPPDDIIVYIGDGYSDFCAAEYSDIVFAKGKLAKYCNENKIPHHTYKTFFDVKQIMIKLISSGRIKQRHQAYLKRKAAFEIE